jgi:DNA-binding transcriptional LysR family regulator
MFENLFSTQGLSLDRLKNFLAFADQNSIVAAAGGDIVRQSLISRQIRELSEFFGVELVKRHGRGLALTEAGRQLATITREQFGALSEFARDAKSLPSILKIAASNSIAIWQIIPKLPEIRRRLPNHQLILQHEQTAAIIRGVAGFALFVPKALANRFNAANATAWMRLPLALPIGGTLRETVDKIAMKHGITLSPALTCDSYVQAVAAVGSGAVAAILPVIAGQSLIPRGAQMVHLPELGQRHPKTLMIWNQRATATRASLATAVEVLPKLLIVE